MRSSCSAIAIACLFCLILPLGAQRVIAWDSTVGMSDEITAVSPAFPMGGIPMTPWPGPPAVPPAPFPLGAVAFDNTTGIQYASDGLVIASGPYPFYPPGPPPPPVFPWTFPGGMGPIHGMEIDGLAGILWVTDGLLGCAVLPVPGCPIVIPPFPIVGPVPVAAPPLTGLDWDPFSGSLWAVDSAGFLYNFLPGGAYLGPGPAPVPPFPGPPVTGLALDKTAPFSGFYVSTPGLIVDYLSGAGAPPGAAGAVDGLAFHGLPASLGGAGTCVAGAALPALMPMSPAWSGNPVFSYSITGFTPGTPLLLLFDTPTGALLPFGIPFSSGVLFFNPFFSPTFSVLPLPPMPPTGPLVIAAALGPVPAFPPGLLGYAQVLGFECPAGPMFFSLTDCSQFSVSLP